MELNLTQVLAIIWSLWAVACATTIARFFLRRAAQGRLRAEDYLAFLAFAFLSGLTAVVTREAIIFMMVQTYLLEAMEDPLTPLPLPQDQFNMQSILALKLMFSQMLLFWSALWAGKFSLLVFFRQLVNGLPRYMYIWWAVFAMVFLTYLASMLSNFLTCVPLEKYWSAKGCSDPEDLRRSDASIKFATSVDIVSDFLIMFLPLRLLITLRVNLKQKLALTGLFSLGTIVVVFAFVRLFEVTKATAESQTDATKVAKGPILLSLWSAIEASVAVIVTNLPAFRSLLGDRGATNASKSGNTYRPGHSSRMTFGSTGNRSGPSALVGQSIEMESLHSSDDEHALRPGALRHEHIMADDKGLSDAVTFRGYNK